MDAQIATEVIGIIAEEAGCTIDDISIDEQLSDVGIDSLDSLNLLMSLEERFSIEIPDALVQTPMTVRQIIEAVERLHRAVFDGSDVLTV